MGADVVAQRASVLFELLLRQRARAASQFDAHAGIVVRHPFLGIDYLPALVEVARSGGDVGVHVGHALPGARIAVLESEALCIRAVAQDHRIAAILYWTKDVGAQHEAVVHLDRDIPIDAHAVAHLAAMFMAAYAGARVPDRSHLRSPGATQVVARFPCELYSMVGRIPSQFPQEEEL